MELPLPLTINDYLPYKAISLNTNTSKKLDPYSNEAMIIDLKNELGNAFFNDLVKDYQSSPSFAKYSELYNGSTWIKNGIEYTHKGLKVVLVYWGYARYIRDSNNESTAFGQRVKSNEFSEPISEATLSRLIEQAKSAGYSFMSDVIRFMEDNKKDYPLWKNNCGPTKTGRSIITGA